MVVALQDSKFWGKGFVQHAIVNKDIQSYKGSARSNPRLRESTERLINLWFLRRIH